MIVKTTRKRTPAEEESSAGTYVFDRKLGRVVRVSDRIPKVASKASGRGETGPCGRSECAGGRCANA